MSGRWADRPQGRDLPSNWSTTRPRILKRDPHCQLQHAGCTTASTEVDHIDDPDDHSDTNLRGVCHHCHAKRTAEQAAAGRAAWAERNPRRRPTRPHPGVRPATPPPHCDEAPNTLDIDGPIVTTPWGVTPEPPGQSTGTA